MQPPIRDLGRRERRRQIALTVLRTALSTALLFVLYAFAPVQHLSAIDTLIRVVVALLIVAVVIAIQVHSIVTATYPRLRAIEAAVTVVAIFVVLFALLYLGLATASPASFNRPLTRVSALYFTVTVLGTVGFGDITPQTDVAQLVVTFQMLLDLALIAVIVRVFTAAARTGAARRVAEKGREDR
jgi:hypothetical protein